MTDQWKLPRYERTIIRQRKDQLRDRIEDLRLTIIRDQVMVDNWKYQKEQAEKTLASLERNYPCDEE